MGAHLHSVGIGHLAVMFYPLMATAGVDHR
jgi:hypothetical protein